jgi:hypothetical protein
MKNLRLFIETIKTLKSSQGLYCRLWNQVQELSLSDLKRLARQLPNFNDSVDVILYLES